MTNLHLLILLIYRKIVGDNLILVVEYLWLMKPVPIKQTNLAELNATYNSISRVLHQEELMAVVSCEQHMYSCYSRVFYTNLENCWRYSSNRSDMKAIM